MFQFKPEQTEVSNLKIGYKVWLENTWWKILEIKKFKNGLGLSCKSFLRKKVFYRSLNEVVWFKNI